MRGVSAGLPMGTMTPSLQPGLDHLGGEELVVVTTLQPPRLLLGGPQLLGHLLQTRRDLGLGSLGLVYSLPNYQHSILK